MKFNVITNGFPKAGNHALVKACELLGVPASVIHLPYWRKEEHFEQEGLVDPKTIFIKRDPRNIVVSWIRFLRNPVTVGMFLTKFRKFREASLIDEMANFEPWLTHPNSLVIRYEDLIASEDVIRQIAAFVGVPYLEGAFPELPGATRTWNDVPSDYRTVWTPEVERIWNEEGGGELLSRWGY